MIVNIHRFIATASSRWDELERILDRLEKNAEANLSLDEVERLHFLYRTVGGDLMKITTFSAEPELRMRLESLVGRAYSEIYGRKNSGRRFHPLRWFWFTFPATFRRHGRAFALIGIILLCGMGVGAYLSFNDTDVLAETIPFDFVNQDPNRRVAAEEQQNLSSRLQGNQIRFSSQLIANNVRVGLFCLALGITAGIGTSLLTFYNGVILGVLCQRYLAAGQWKFLLGWLLPHGVVEIPAVLIAAQAGMIIAMAMLDTKRGYSLRQRLAPMIPDVMTLAGGFSLLLVWAGIMESFFSQYHAPVMPYGVKISVGVTELILLTLFLFFAGRRASKRHESRDSE